MMNNSVQKKPFTGARIENADPFFTDAPGVVSEIVLQRRGNHLNVPWEGGIVSFGQFIAFGTEVCVDLFGEFHIYSFLPKGAGVYDRPRERGPVVHTAS